MDFALNQKTAPKLGFAAFLDLAAELGCVGVEPRNDLGRPFFDGIEPARAGEMARERGLRFIGLSEVYPFNNWNEVRRAAVARLIEAAQAAGAETISLIPRVDRREGESAERASTLSALLADIAAMPKGQALSAWWNPSASRPLLLNFSARPRRRSKAWAPTIALELYTTRSNMRWQEMLTS